MLVNGMLGLHASSGIQVFFPIDPAGFPKNLVEKLFAGRYLESFLVPDNGMFHDVGQDKANEPVAGVPMCSFQVIGIDEGVAALGRRS